MHEVGFEPTHTNINGPKPFPLDHSGIRAKSRKRLNK